MTAITRFPTRNVPAIFVTEAAEGGWLVTARGHGWLHGTRFAALVDAFFLARNLDFPIREYPEGNA